MVKIGPAEAGGALTTIVTNYNTVHSTMRYRRTRITILLMLFMGGLLLVVLATNALQDWETVTYFGCLLGWREWIHSGEEQEFGPSCNVYNIRRPARGNFDCLPLVITPSPLICIHNPDDDIFISATIKDGEVWESNIVNLFQAALKQDKSLAVIDIGANIGQYSLIAAKMGRTVIAVEPYLKHVEMIHKALDLNGFRQNFTLVYNAVSDSHKTVALQFKKENRGAIRVIESQFQAGLQTHTGNGCLSWTSGSHVQTIVMDDLLEVVTFTKAIMKIDIEGHEARAVPHAQTLLATVYVPYIFMEWEVMAKENDEYKKEGIKILIEFLETYYYEAYSLSGQKLLNSNWKSWPPDMIWKHKNAKILALPTK